MLCIGIGVQMMRLIGRRVPHILIVMRTSLFSFVNYLKAVEGRKEGAVRVEM